MERDARAGERDAMAVFPQHGCRNHGRGTCMIVSCFIGYSGVPNVRSDTQRLMPGNCTSQWCCTPAIFGCKRRTSGNGNGNGKHRFWTRSINLLPDRDLSNAKDGVESSLCSICPCVPAALMHAATYFQEKPEVVDACCSSDNISISV